METDGRDGIRVAETERIIGCAFAVLNSLGHGFHEKYHAEALVVDFCHYDIPYAQQARFPIYYRNIKVGEYIPNLFVFGKVTIDTKTTERIKDRKVGRMQNYLRATGLQLGLINFKQAKPQFRRVILTPLTAPLFHLKSYFCHRCSSRSFAVKNI